MHASHRQRGMRRPDFGEAFYDIGAHEFQETFAGQPGTKSCCSDSESALVQQFGTLDAAATESTVLPKDSDSGSNAPSAFFCRQFAAGTHFGRAFSRLA